MCQTLIVKNTFICAVDSDDLSPEHSGRRRAHTAGPVVSFEEEDVCTRGVVLEALSRQRDSLGPRFVYQEMGAQAAVDALAVATPQEAAEVAAGLRGMVLEASRATSAHLVLLELIHRLAAEETAFIVMELRGHARSSALNVYGSAVVSCLIEYGGQDPLTSALVDEVLAEDPAGLCCHKFGHVVANAVLSNGLPRQRALVLSTLNVSLQRFARHRYASQVLEHALCTCAAAEGAVLAGALMEQPGAAVALACHIFGVQVVRAMLQLEGPCADQVLEYLRAGTKRLLKDKYGSALASELRLDSSSPPLPAAAPSAKAVALYSASIGGA